MDPILNLPDTLPPHKAAVESFVSSEVLTTWPEGTFVENLAVLDDGTIAVSVLSEARLDRVRLDGSRELLAQFSAPPTGLVVVDGMLYTTVGELGKGPISVWQIDPTTGHSEALLSVNGSMFLNGLTRLNDHILLSADSHLGSIFKIDLRERSSSIWLSDEKLTPSPLADFLPGANGIKRFRNSVIVSSNSRALLFKIPVLADGSAGELELVSEDLRVDDFAFDIEGNGYLTTHIGNSLDRLSPNGTRVSIAGVNQGMAGSTSCAFGRTRLDRTHLYVTTTGGLFGPPNGILQPAKLVRLEVGVEGAEI